MATLTIRNLPERVRDRLRLRAARRGVSMEEEVRCILADAADSRPAPASAGAAGAAVKELQRWITSQRKTSGGANDSAALIRDRRRDAILEVLRAGEDPRAVFRNNYRRVLDEAEWTATHVKGLARRGQ